MFLGDSGSDWVGLLPVRSVAILTDLPRMKPTLMAGLAMILAATFLSPAAEPAELPAAQVVLDRYIEGAGGRSALEKLKTRVVTGKMEVTSLGVSGGMSVKSKAPNKQVSSIDLAGLGSMREGYDGTVAWSQAPGIGVQVKSGGELVRVQRTTAFPRELKIKETYDRFETKSAAKVGTVDAWLIEASAKGGKPDRLYFDQKSGLLLREESTVNTAVGEMTFQIDFLDYRAVDGVKVPFLVKIPKPETMGFQVTVDEVKHNVDIADAEFSKPKN